MLCDIARTAFAVVGRLLSRDQLLARELRSSTTGSRQIYREECITVEMASELRERYPHHVEITLFTPPEETRTGADWYWRFEKAGGAIHARVQAKRVQRTEFGQADDRGRVDLDMPQLAQLVRATRDPGEKLAGLQAWLAMYARFDASPPCGNEDLQRCDLHRHGTPCASHRPSLWIAQAQEFIDQEFIDGKRVHLSVTDIRKKSLRLDCILPCIDGSQAKGGPASKGFTIQSGLRSYRDCVSAIEADARLRKEFEGALRIAV
ncbi:MAG TPA: DUF6615 family protein [Gemmatimonadaceae bacterium]